MIEIRKEAEEIILGKQPKDNNLLTNAPHPISVIVSSEEDWKRFVLFSSLSLMVSSLNPTIQTLFPRAGSLSFTVAT
jgi:hypothetical protein